MNIHVICNPKSGNGEGKNVLQKTVTYFREHEIAAAFHETQGPKHAVELAAQAVKDGSRVSRARIQPSASSPPVPATTLSRRSAFPWIPNRP